MQSLFKEKFLLFRIKAKKDPEAFGEIYDAYVRPIHRFIAFKVATQEQAEDLTSETFLKAWQYLRESKEVKSLQALLYSIARSVVIDHYRHSAVTETSPLEDGQGNLLTDIGSEKLAHDIETGLDVSLVIEKLRGLKEEYRDAILLKYFDQLSAAEIGEILGKSSASVRVLLHRAMKALTDTLQHERQTAADNLPKDQR